MVSCGHSQTRMTARSTRNRPSRVEFRLQALGNFGAMQFARSCFHLHLSFQSGRSSALAGMPARERPVVLIIFTFVDSGAPACTLGPARGHVKVEFYQISECPARGCTKQAMQRSQGCQAYSEDLAASGLQSLGCEFSPSYLPLAVNYD